LFHKGGDVAPRNRKRALDVFSIVLLMVFGSALLFAFGAHHKYRLALFRVMARTSMEPIQNDLFWTDAEGPRNLLRSTYSYSPYSASAFERAFRFSQIDLASICAERGDDGPTTARWRSYSEFSLPILPVLHELLTRDGVVMKVRCTFETSLRELSDAFLKFAEPLAESGPITRSLVDTQLQNAAELNPIIAKHLKAAGLLEALAGPRVDAASALQQQLAAEGIVLKLDDPRYSAGPQWIAERGSVFCDDIRQLVSSCEASAADPVFLSKRDTELEVQQLQARALHSDGSELGLDSPSLASGKPWRPIEYMLMKRCRGVDLAEK
jgi:hypothetical protein